VDVHQVGAAHGRPQPAHDALGEVHHQRRRHPDLQPRDGIVKGLGAGQQVSAIVDHLLVAHPVGSSWQGVLLGYLLAAHGFGAYLAGAQL
jgi:hypothetical protein